MGSTELIVGTLAEGVMAFRQSSAPVSSMSWSRSSTTLSPMFGDYILFSKSRSASVVAESRGLAIELMVGADMQDWKRKGEKSLGRCLKWINTSETQQVQAHPLTPPRPYSRWNQLYIQVEEPNYGRIIRNPSHTLQIPDRLKGDTVPGATSAMAAVSAEHERRISGSSNLPARIRFDLIFSIRKPLLVPKT